MKKIKECKICGNRNNNKVHVARELMFGYRDEFEYIECSQCGCLQITEIPENLSKYYSTNYYSYQQPKSGLKVKKLFTRFSKKKKYDFLLYRKDFIGLILTIIGKEIPVWLKKAKIEKQLSILDVGCGSGQTLLELKEYGFTNLSGIDPYINNDILYENGICIKKTDLSEISRKYDVIMLHHSYEHMPDPFSTMRSLYNILKKEGLLLIRIPTVSSYAWQKYQANWVQLDAPRHLFLHSLKSMEIITHECGFSIEKIAYDSWSFQFWGSEQYIKGIPLMDKKTNRIRRDRSIFSKYQINKFKRKARMLNKKKIGDSICFYLRKTSNN